jgi:competence protein ComEC
MPVLEILNVGHGNCSLVTASTEYAVIDAPLRDPLVSVLLNRRISRISAVVVSHADADHLAGVQALLYDERIFVDRLFVNPEQKRETTVWSTFKVAAAQAAGRGTKILSVTRDSSEEIAVSDVTLEVLSPSGVEILAGAEGSIGDELFTANRLSAVIRVVHNSIGRVLLPGDMDAAALDAILETALDMSADVLVFPHHGGASNMNPSEFTDKLLTATQPSLVAFSLSHRYRNPLPEIVEGVRGSEIRICCTGLSTHCDAAALGGSSCAGTVTIDLATGSWDSRENERHKTFASTNVTNPLCRRCSD